MTGLIVRIVTPAPRGALHGNRVTALRWASIARSLGAHVTVGQTDDGRPADILIAIHALKSAAAIESFRRRHPSAAVVVALAGTDLYATSDVAERSVVERSLATADRVVVLQPEALDALPTEVAAKSQVVAQSCTAPTPMPAARTDVFEVCVVAHLRDVKDPLACARAARGLPSSSALVVTHVGAALTEDWAAAATAESATNPRYQWCGAVPRAEALRLIARSRLLVVTSHAEGGANVVSEAVVCDTPVLSTRIAGSVGILGADYPGYVPVGDTAALTQMLGTIERDPGCVDHLRQRCRAVAPRYARARERAAWQTLFAELR